MTEVLKYVLILVEVVTSILLVGVILIQKSKSQGMGLAFGSGMGESLFGSQVGNVLTRSTVVLAVVFLVNTTVLAIMGRGVTERSVADEIAETPPPATAPAVAPADADMPRPPTDADMPIPAADADMPIPAADGDMPVTAPGADAPAAPSVRT